MGDIFNWFLLACYFVLSAVLAVFYCTAWVRYKRVICEKLPNDPSTNGGQRLKVTNLGTFICTGVCFFDLLIGLLRTPDEKPVFSTFRIFVLIMLAMSVALFSFTIYVENHTYITAEGIYHPFLKKKYGFILKSTDITYKVTDNKLEIFAPDNPRPNIFYIKKNRGEILKILTENYNIRV